MSSPSSVSRCDFSQFTLSARCEYTQFTVPMFIVLTNVSSPCSQMCEFSQFTLSARCEFTLFTLSPDVWVPMFTVLIKCVSSPCSHSGVWVLQVHTISQVCEFSLFTPSARCLCSHVHSLQEYEFPCSHCLQVCDFTLFTLSARSVSSMITLTPGLWVSMFTLLVNHMSLPVHKL